MLFTRKKSLAQLWQGAKFDKSFFIAIALLTIIGFMIFLSASLGLQARGNGSTINLILNQAFFGIIGGGIAATITYHIPLKKIQQYAVPIFIFSILITLAVHIPGLGLSSGGATRWLDIGPLSLQPSEILKIGTVVMVASWFSFLKRKVGDLKLGLGSVIAISVGTAGILLSQPDTGTAVVIISAIGSIYLIAGGKWRHILLLIVIASMSLALLMTMKPYIKDRLTTFLDPTSDPLGASYQTRQSMIAVGSGQLFGRGPGQSIQKFNYVPEPVSDSIFAIYAEEYGFVGSIVLLALYTVIGFLGLNIANRLKPGFEKLLVVGLITMILVQSILNIGAMVGVFPLSGMPLIFVSHGGTALMFSLVSAALILKASTKVPKRHRNKL